MLNGCAMDAASYERHRQAKPCAAQDTTPTDPFSQEQDFRAIAAKAFEQDRTAMQPQHSAAPATEYRPGTAQFVSGEWLEVEAPQRMMIPSGTLTVHGSGSYYTSGSYYLTSGSYRLSSGSYYLTSGSYYRTSGSYSPTSGSYHLTSGSYSVPSEAVPFAMSSSMQLLGGYGLGAI